MQRAESADQAPEDEEAAISRRGVRRPPVTARTLEGWMRNQELTDRLKELSEDLARLSEQAAKEPELSGELARLSRRVEAIRIIVSVEG
jgi:uncharacterized protein involved in exopolysaccharide biosynthesis